MARCSTAEPPSSRHLQARRGGWRSTARCIATTPALRRGAVAGRGEHGVRRRRRLVEWIGTEQTESLGPQSIHQRRANPDAAVPVRGATRGRGPVGGSSRAGMEMKVLLWAVQRLIDACRRSAPNATSRRGCTWCARLAQPWHVRRRRSAYSEAKSALDAVVRPLARRKSSWAARVSQRTRSSAGPAAPADGPQRCHRVRRRRGRSHHLLDRRDGGAAAFDLCDAESKVAAARSPIKADLTEIDMAGWRPRRASRCRQRRGRRQRRAPGAAALPSPPGVSPRTAAAMGRPRVADPADSRRRREIGNTARHAPGSRWSRRRAVGDRRAGQPGPLG